MLVEINLLPQKEPKKFAFIITLSSLLAVFLVIGGFYFWQTQSVKDELTSLDRQISTTKKIAEKEQQNSETVASSSSVSQLKSAIEWAKDYPIQTVPVMQHLTSLLPERGFIQTFGYTESGAVTLTVQFDSAREAAYFLDSLNHSKWIEEASLNSLAATETNTETDTNAANNTAASNSQANTTSTTTSATSPTTSESTTTVDNQNNSSTDPALNQNNTMTTTTNQNTVSNSSTTASKSNTSNYLPRYTGQFEIMFNKEEIKKILQQGNKDGEGVKGS
ncbi:fimbrial assembly family protein [Neobacillus vireti LMG 21834]|uniref:Fimbrial assembly family protein n=2 Tax=Neobacillus TaxID=2675232 RepID=A0AB94ITD0_9BACI|nr:fimbrial assembly family protein [Neobacillus vireti LMG 21834]